MEGKLGGGPEDGGFPILGVGGVLRMGVPNIGGGGGPKDGGVLNIGSGGGVLRMGGPQY